MSNKHDTPDPKDTRDADDDTYPPPCTNPSGHSWVISEETDRCYCEYCLADGDA